ncbi:GAF domain-containing protein [Oerskovia sp. Sa1BUA8]|uniref:GAF domain-containing protein n=1 Tax=Oerskovia douganii TaxID=2762210 RepID=A0A9D5U658_9CELL|nr:GAF domain-containing protein [Oerskovia douganii]MBE7699243.1 GAF domain-containing protein [Oerskovia douganii]
MLNSQPGIVSRLVKDLWRAVLSAASRSTLLGPVSALLLAAAGLLVGPWGLWTLAVAGPGAIGVVVEALSKRVLAREAGEFKLLVYGCLGPLVRCLAVLASKTTPTKRKDALPDVLWAALTAALSLTNPDGSRASFFVRERIDGDDCLLPHPTLTWGRGDDPVSRFFRSSGEGIEVWRQAETGVPSFCEDLETKPPEGIDLARERSYRTYITAPLMVSGRVAGLLTINAAKPGDLTKVDVGVVQVLARLASAAISLCGGAWADTGTQSGEGG